MSFIDLFDRLVVTEKASNLAEGGDAMVFYSSSIKVSKEQVKSAIESFLKDVSVKSVRSMVVKPSARRFKGRVGFTKKRKKFIVSFVDGSNINLLNVVGGG